jgi:predicted nucleic acid-binding protein
LRLVVDASVVIKWFVSESGHEFAAALLSNFPDRYAPDFVAVETANVLWKKVRRGETSLLQAEQALAELPRFFRLLVPTRHLVARALQISLELDHTIYDCIYLACAEKESAKLVTADARLANKCTNNSFAGGVVFMDRVLDPATLG